VISEPAILLNVSPPSQSFSFIQGDAPSAGQNTVNIGVLSNPSSTVFTATASTATGGSWLTIPAAFRQNSPTPGTIPVTVNPAGLAPNTYLGQINISAPGATP